MYACTVQIYKQNIYITKDIYYIYIYITKEEYKKFPYQTIHQYPLHNTSSPQYILSTIHPLHNTSSPQYILSTIHPLHNTSSPQYILSTIHRHKQTYVSLVHRQRQKLRQWCKKANAEITHGVGYIKLNGTTVGGGGGGVDIVNQRPSHLSVADAPYNGQHRKVLCQ